MSWLCQKGCRLYCDHQDNNDNHNKLKNKDHIPSVSIKDISKKNKKILKKQYLLMIKSL